MTALSSLEALNAARFDTPAILKRLAPKAVPKANIFKIFVPDAKVEKFVMSLLTKQGLQVGVSINRAMFL